MGIIAFASRVFATLGNHDHWVDAQGAAAALQKHGYAVLQNENTTLTLRGEPYTVVGVAPPGFDFPMGAEVWAPLAFDAKEAVERQRRTARLHGLRAGALREELSYFATCVENNTKPAVITAEESMALDMIGGMTQGAMDMATEHLAEGLAGAQDPAGKVPAPETMAHLVGAVEITCAILVLLGLVVSASAAGPPRNERVLVVYNAYSKESRQVARHYVQARQVPERKRATSERDSTPTRFSGRS